MNKMVFQKHLTMSVGKPQNEGELTLGGKPITCSAPAVMNGRGVGTNPEELLVSAVAACYSLTLCGGAPGPETAGYRYRDGCRRHRHP